MHNKKRMKKKKKGWPLRSIAGISVSHEGIVTSRGNSHFIMIKQNVAGQHCRLTKKNHKTKTATLGPRRGGQTQAR